MQLRRNVLFVLLIIAFIYFEIHSCSEDALIAPDNEVTIASNIMCDATEVYFTDSDFGWVVGSHGTIIYTSDGGDEWNGTMIDDVDLSDIYFLDRECGWTVGKGGSLYKSLDGGSTWERIQFTGEPQDDDLSKIKFMNESLGFVLGYHGVFRTDDGGVFWQNNWLPVVPYRGAWGMSLVNGDTAFLLGSFWTKPDPELIYVTRDGGNSWSGVAGTESSILSSILTIEFVDENTGWAGGGIIMKTTDGGMTWTTQVGEATVREFFFFSDQYGFAVGGDRILRTADGGNAWINVTPDDDSVVDLRGCHFHDESTGWVVGRGLDEEIEGVNYKHSIVLKTTDGGESWSIEHFKFDCTAFSID